MCIRDCKGGRPLAGRGCGEEEKPAFIFAHQMREGKQGDAAQLLLFSVLGYS